MSSTTIRQQALNVVRSGSVQCVYCCEVVACKMLEKHCSLKHKDKKDLCVFCGIYTMKRNKSGLRVLLESKEHFVACAKEAKKKFKTKPEQPKPVFEVGSEISTIFKRRRGNELVFDSVVLTENSRCKEALENRSKRLSGEEEQLAMAENIRTDDVERVETGLWLDYDFGLPEWLESLMESFGNRATSNRLEFHKSFNIDTVWPKVYGMEQLEFFHVFVHMCIFEKFRQLIETHKDKCSLLRYACMCNKHDRIHVHVVMVALKEARIQRFFNHGQFECEITTERRKLAKAMKEEGIEIVPSWPDHRHFHMKEIMSEMHLFNTLCYISNHESAPSKINRLDHVYELINVTTKEQHSIQQQVHALIKRYVTDRSQNGNHFYIFRSLSKDAPVWFSSISRNGLYSYVRYIMDKRSVIDELDKVLVNNFQRCSLEYRHIMQYLIQAAIPLRDQDYMYHGTCNNKAISVGRRDLDRYIHLGRNDYMYLARGSTPCCDAYSKDIFFANQPQLLYNMTSKQMHEHDIYKKWVEKTRSEKDVEIARLKSVMAERSGVTERLVSEISEKDEEIKRLRLDVANRDAQIVTKDLAYRDLEIKYLKENRGMAHEKDDQLSVYTRKYVKEVEDRRQIELELARKRLELDNVRGELDEFKCQTRKQTRQIEVLRNQVAHTSQMLAKKQGPYLESNDKSNVLNNKD